MANFFQRNGANRTDFNTGNAFLTGKPFRILLTIKADNRIESTFGKGQKGAPVLSPAYMYTFPAQNAAIGIIIQEGMVFLNPPVFYEVFQMLRF